MRVFPNGVLDGHATQPGQCVCTCRVEDCVARVHICLYLQAVGVDMYVGMYVGMYVDMYGHLQVAGYGSLMDEGSARETNPGLRNWRYGRLNGYARVFDLVSIINIRKGLASGRQLTTCTARERKGCELHVCMYDVPVGDWPELIARERRLDCRVVEVTEDESGRCCQALLFCRVHAHLRTHVYAHVYTHVRAHVYMLAGASVLSLFGREVSC